MRDQRALCGGRRSAVLRRATCCGALVLLAGMNLTPRVLQSQDASSPRSVPSTRGKANVLTGTVVDVIGRPMENSEVYIAGTGRSVRTDARGRWRFDDPPVGPRLVVARQLGYIPYAREMEIGSNANDTVSLLLRRYPRTLSTVEVNARSKVADAYAQMTAERLMQLRVGSGRLYTREQILQLRPYSIAELIAGAVGVDVTSGRGSIVATTRRVGVGATRIDGQACQLQFFLDGTPIDNEGVATLSPLDFRSVEVYPQTVVLTGLTLRPDKCGAIVINSMRR